MTLSEAFEAYRTEVLLLKGQSPRTEEGLLTSKKVLVSAFDDRSVVSITHDDIRSWHTSLRNKRLKTNTIRGYILHLRLVLRHCKSKGIEVVDAEQIIVPRREETIPFVLSPGEVQHLIDSIKPCKGRKLAFVYRNRAIVSLLYASGLRVSELCSLERRGWQDGRTTVLGKGNKPRLVFWDDRTKKLLSEYMQTRNDNNPALFTSPISGRRINRMDIIELFTMLKKQSGIEGVHAHTMRHSYATNLMSQGMHIYSLSRLMGHANISTTQQYLHISDPKLEEEYLRYHTT